MFPCVLFLFSAVNMFEHLFLEINNENKECLVGFFFFFDCVGVSQLDVKEHL